MQNSHTQLRVAVEGLQLMEETPRRLLVHRIPSLWAVYPHGNQAPPALSDHRLSRRWWHGMIEMLRRHGEKGGPEPEESESWKRVASEMRRNPNRPWLQAATVDHNTDRHGPGRDPGSIMEMCVSVVAWGQNGPLTWHCCGPTEVQLSTAAAGNFIPKSPTRKTKCANPGAGKYYCAGEQNYAL